MTRLMKDPDFRAAQHARAFTDPHIRPINEFIDGLRDRDGRGWAPYVAPHHGGVDAEILSILRDPGPKAHFEKGSGFLSVENDDVTAERQCTLFAANGIPSRVVLPWNGYPWYINAAPDKEQSLAGARVIRELLHQLAAVRIVLLQGNDAQRIWDLVVEEEPDIVSASGVSVHKTIHPSPQALFHRDPEVRSTRRKKQEDTYADIGALLAAHRDPTTGVEG
ncbi:uracil-DNA glycosylase [Clavibacter michiganensis subsp. phaseoli]|uniref:uracil-DNA glycosylase n=1 Tax=Clavibacter phaseoli TaxID=1734031 RepID=UPI001FB56CB8|nr:uracil-DNA glycosylase [Clavibacter phaseoli]MCJ1709634.1 uracil-DNA glycosylase [Clavibacter phaseoli]